MNNNMGNIVLYNSLKEIDSKIKELQKESLQIQKHRKKY